MEWLKELDTDLFLWLNFSGPSWLDQLMWWMSKTWFWIPVDAILLLALIRRYQWKRGIVLALFFAVLITLTDQISSAVLKPATERLRPSREDGLKGLIHHVRDENGNFYIGGQYGFVSSHAANYAGVAILFYLLAGPVALWVPLALSLWVILLSYSRIYLGVHYPGDVIGGWLVGAACAWLLYVLAKKLKLSAQ